MAAEAGSRVVFLVAFVVLSAVAVPLFGGRLGALLEVRLRHPWAVLAALALEVAAVNWPGLPDRLRAGLLVAAYPLGAGFLVAHWRGSRPPPGGPGAAPKPLG